MDEVNVPSQTPSSGFGIAGFILGIIGLFTGTLGILFGILGLILCIVQIKTKKTGLAIAGLVISIIAIIVGLIFAIIFLWAVLFTVGTLNEYQNAADTGSFYSRLQYSIDKARASESYEDDFKINAPSGVTKICFVNFAGAITNNADYNLVQSSKDSGANLVIINPKIGNSEYTLSHISIEQVTQNSNPYCVPASGNLKIKREFTDSFVSIE